jgi:hypothetical protein
MGAVYYTVTGLFVEYTSLGNATKVWFDIDTVNIIHLFAYEDGTDRVFRNVGI